MFHVDDDKVNALSDHANHPGIQLEHQERAQVLYAAIDQLPENQRAAFILHKVEGLSHREIGETLNLNVPAIESLIHRAKKNLRKLLSDYYKKEQI